MIKNTLILAILIFILSMQICKASNRTNKRVKSDIENLLNFQVIAWNEGNIEKFMETYQKSEKLVFVGSQGPTYGWNETYNNYKKNYPTKEIMGKLGFEILDISKIDKNTAFVVGKFLLTRNKDTQKGSFTLVFQKINGKWLIISDHTSSIK